MIPVLECAHGAAIRILERESLIFQSTSPSEVVTCLVGSGTTIHVLCKYSGPQDHVAHGHRGGTTGEAVVYQEVLVPLGVTKPRLLGTHLDPETGETWLFLEYLEGGERVSKAVEPGAMAAAARWLGQFQASAEDRMRRGFAPPLRVYDRGYYLGWARRTVEFAESIAVRFPWLATAASKFQGAAEVLLRAPATVTHGEFYPRNVLWVNGAVVPVDWESAAIGAGELDLATLLEGWDSDTTQACETAYLAARWPAGAPDSFVRTLQAARFFVEFRWLGDNVEWTLNQSNRYRFEELHRLATSWG